MSQFSAALRRAHAAHEEAVREAKQARHAPRVEPVALPVPRKLRVGVAHRPAEDVPLNVRPVVVLRPVPDDAQTVHEFCIAQFPVPARKLAR